MSYSANQYNYCTPLSSAVNFTDSGHSVDDKKYFTLFDNVLDGSYYPITGDVGLWGVALSDSSGVLATPFVVTVEENLSLTALSIVGSKYAYPVAFTIQFYNGDTLLHTITETANNTPAYTGVLPSTLDITKYVVTITKISAPESVVRLYNSYKAYYIRLSDTVSIKQSTTRQLVVTARGADTQKLSIAEVRAIVNTVSVADRVPMKLSETTAVFNTIDKTYDTLSFKQLTQSAITNTIDVTRDSLKVKGTEDASHVINTAEVSDTLKVISGESSVPTNIHTVMKEPTRRVYGKVYITYTDPMLNDVITDIVASSEAYNSNVLQLTDGTSEVNNLFFTLYDNNLSGRYQLSSKDSQVGWTSGVLSGEDGYFDVPPYVVLNFAARPIYALSILFDNSHGCLVEDFTVELASTSGAILSVPFTGNTSVEVAVPLEAALIDIISIKITVSKVSKAYYPATILEIPTLSTYLYAGYQDSSDLISISLLEELTYEDDIEALGGVSANEVTVKLDNSTRQFNINNKESPVASQLRRNRKVEPWLGAEVLPGQIEWHQLGVFWSYEWNVPFDNLTVSVTAFDTIGLLDTTDFINHQVLTNKSLGELVDYVLTDAKQILSFLEWTVADELYGVIIPYAWFAKGSHAAALRKISLAYPMHIYCDRLGRICAAPQKLHLDYYQDSWSDNTNVIDKTYSSLYTVLPNIVNVTVVSPALEEVKSLVKDTLIFNVSEISSRTLTFNAPYVSNLVVTMDKDSTVSYNYTVYSWGIEITFTGRGTVRSIECVGTALDTSNTVLLSRKDTNSIQLNGAVTRDISADFIQTSSLANFIMDRLDALSENDKYDVKVNYRGDIGLTINDPVLLQDTISPDNRYNIKRHQLTWDGSLSGTADLNT